MTRLEESTRGILRPSKISQNMYKDGFINVDKTENRYNEVVERLI